jgi:hypothetical protein
MFRAKQDSAAPTVLHTVRLVAWLPEAPKSCVVMGSHVPAGVSTSTLKRGQAFLSFVVAPLILNPPS